MRIGRWVAALLLCGVLAQAEKGMIQYPSRYSVDETGKRLVRILREHGVRLFKVIDHAEGAARAGVTLPPSKLFIFGNPKMGAPLMECSPTLGLDLPQKVLIYRDKKGEVKIVYNAPAYLIWRHSIPVSCHLALQKKLGNAVDRFVREAAGYGKKSAVSSAP